MSAVPSTFGKYFLTEKIATGGMAEIYLAKILGPGGFEKFLVIKKIHPKLSGERQFVEMFVAEAKTLVGLTHGNIVPIYELGMVDSTYFIAMEYIDGPTLEQLLTALRRADVSLSPAMTAYICAEILKGLDYAHRKGEGVIHRDLSPRNVMLSREGEVKLVDFGIAVAQVERASEVQGSTEDPAGSYPHMSPEQVQGAPLDPRSDIFATGILLWEMLTGRQLFARATDQETLAAVLTAPIAPASEFCRGAAGVLDVVCARALERKVEDRFSTAGDFLVAINRFLYSQGEMVTPKDVSSFIAKHCPPTTQEFARPATLGVSEETPNGSGTVPTSTDPRKPRKRSGTVPMDRPQGKRAATVQSFATHVTLRAALNHVDEDEDEDEDEDDDASSVRLPPQQVARTPESVETPTTSVQAESSEARAAPRSSLLLPLAGTAALLAAGVVLFVGRSNGTSTQAVAEVSDAARAPADAALASPFDAAEAVLAIAPDARRATKDAGTAMPRRRPDARAEVAMGTIRVGANPWADVFLDGKAIGRAPGNFEVPAGAHSLELRFHEQSKTVQIDVKPSQMTSVGVVDFTVE